MARARWSRPAIRFETEALVLKRTRYRDSDLIIALYTERAGRIAAMARAAVNSRRRYGGALEPFHTVRVELEEREGVELLDLREATLSQLRHGLVQSLEAMQAAGTALTWVRRAAPPRVREPAVWTGLIELLDRLDASSVKSASLHLAEQGLRLLGAFGWGLDLESCVCCRRACEEGRTATVDAVKGGIVCRSCGGARMRLTGAQRRRLAAAGNGVLQPEDAGPALELVEAAIRAHVSAD